MHSVRGCTWGTMVLLAALGLGAAGCTGGGRPVGTLHSPRLGDSGTEMSLPTRWANFSLTDPPTAFNALSTRIAKDDVSHPGISYDTNTEHHIQSYSFYNRGNHLQQFHIFDANESKTGTIYITKNKDNKTYGGTKITRFDAPTGFAHPAGMQIIGDYLLVAMEGKQESTNAQGKKTQQDVGAVFMYNLTSVYKDPEKCCGDNKNQAPSTPAGRTPKELIRIVGTASAASSVGITAISGDFKYSPYDKGYYWPTPTRYVIAVHHYEKSVTLYISKQGVTLADANSGSFEKLATYPLPAKCPNDGSCSYDSMALLSDQQSNVWLIGFRSKGITNSFADYADLYKLSNVTYRSSSTVHDVDVDMYPNGRTLNEKLTLPGNVTVGRFGTKQFTTQHGNIAAWAGPHFRWGPGLTIYEDNKLRLNVTERNWGTAGANKVWVNWFFSYK